jgi:large subunit ribosomal protein L10
MSTKKIQKWKTEVLDKFVLLTKKYNIIAVADLEKVRSFQIQEIRKKLRGRVEILVAKNTLVKKAAELLEKERTNLTKFSEAITGSRVLLFTNMNPYELIILLNKNKVRLPAKAGDIASGEIVVPAGNTGLAPGPVISEFGEAKVPTKIESGSIWVVRDTVVARKGDTISPKLVAVLSKLGIKPMEAGLSLVQAYDAGLVLTSEDLAFDLEEFRKNIQQAAQEARGVAVEAGIVFPETAPLIIGKAHRQALALSIQADYPTKETIIDIVKNAYAEMAALSKRIETLDKAAAPTSLT